MYWWQTEEEVKEEIRETVQEIQRTIDELIAKGSEACRQFLIEAGIIE